MLCLGTGTCEIAKGGFVSARRIFSHSTFSVFSSAAGCVLKQTGMVFLANSLNLRKFPLRDLWAPLFYLLREGFGPIFFPCFAL